MKDQKNTLRLGLMLLLMCIAATVADAQVMTLESVLSTIEQKNPMLQEYESKVKALDAYSAGARSWMAPMVGFGPYWYPYPGQQIMDERDKGMFMATIEQDIPNPAKLKARRNYFNARSAVEEQARGAAFNNLRAEAKAHYYTWGVALKKIKVFRENEQILETMIKLARIRYPYNQGTLGTIYKSEARLEEVKNMRIMAEGDIEDSRERLCALMNLQPGAPLLIDTTSMSTAYLLTDTTDLGSHRSDVRQINASIDRMRFNQELQRAQARPDFRIRFDHMQPRGVGMPTQFSAMAMISIPIAPWSSRMYRSEIKGMTYDIEAMQRNKEAILSEARGMIAGMSHKLLRMKQQLENYEQRIIPALGKNFQTLRIAYEENREQLPMVMDGWEALSMAQSEYLEKVESYYIMMVAYEKEIEK